MGQRAGIVDALQSFRRIGLDTPVFVYHIGQPPRWAEAASAVMRAMADGRFSGVTSILTMLEVTTKPLKLGRPEVVDVYEGLLQEISYLTIVNLDLRATRIGAELHAEYGLRTLDDFA